MNEFDYEFSNNEDEDFTYEEPKKVVNKFYQATNDYEKAVRFGLDGDGLLGHYISKGELTKSQALKIKQGFNKGNTMKQDFNLSISPPAKPLVNSSKIVLKGLKALPPRQYLLKRFEIERGTLALLCASGASGKSMLIQYIACCVSSGKPLFGKFDVMKGAVLHLDQEQNALQTQRRYERLAAGLGIDELDIERIDLNRRLDSPEEIKTVEEDLAAHFQGKNIILIDSLKATSEADENSPQIEVILKILKKIAERTKTGVILIHHKGKSVASTKQTGRGHSSIYDSVDIQIDLDWNQETEVAELICRKNRDGRNFNGIKYKLLDTGDFNELQNCSEKLELQLLEDDVKNEKVSLENQVLTAIKDAGKINQTSLFDIIKGSRKTFDAVIDGMIASDYIKESRGAKNARIFEITASGLSLLAWTDDSKGTEK